MTLTQRKTESQRNMDNRSDNDTESTDRIEGMKFFHFGYFNISKIIFCCKELN